MPLPLANLLSHGASLAALLLLGAQASVFTVSTNIPTDVSPCQEVVFDITVNNTSNQAQQAGTLQYCLPQGLQYANVTGLTPSNVSDPRCPVFTLPALPGNGSLSFQLRVRVGCSATDQGDVRDTIRITSGGVPQDPLLGGAYNVRVPS